MNLANTFYLFFLYYSYNSLSSYSYFLWASLRWVSYTIFSNFLVVPTIMGWLGLELLAYWAFSVFFGDGDFTNIFSSSNWTYFFLLTLRLNSLMTVGFLILFFDSSSSINYLWSLLKSGTVVVFNFKAFYFSSPSLICLIWSYIELSLFSFSKFFTIVIFLKFESPWYGISFQYPNTYFYFVYRNLFFLFYYFSLSITSSKFRYFINHEIGLA
jgi:hypothetical protein